MREENIQKKPEKTLTQPMEVQVDGENDTGTAKIIEDQLRSDALRKKIEESETATTDAISQMVQVTAKMMAASSRQKNVSTVIKDGLEQVWEALNKLTIQRESQRMAQERLTGLEVPHAPKKSRSAGTAAGTSAKNKRAVSSPAEDKCQTGDRNRIRDGNEETDWQTVTRKRRAANGNLAPQVEEIPRTNMEGGRSSNSNRKEQMWLPQRQPRKLKKRPRLDAVLIKPANGKTYSDVLRDIKSKIKLEDTDTDIKSIRQTRSGDVLLELGRGTKDVQAFADAVKITVGDAGTVRSLLPRVTLEFLDLDSITTKEEVEEALQRELREKADDTKVTVSNPNRRGQIMAFVEMNEQEAEKLLQTARIRVGWINSRIRRRIYVTRCFKCIGYGHQARDCKGPDRSGLCYKCGKEGHKGASCTEQLQCVLCTGLQENPESLNHVPGSGACKSFRQALNKEKQKYRR